MIIFEDFSVNFLYQLYNAGEDEAIKKLFSNYDKKFKKPDSLAEFVSSSMTDDAPYIAIFLPGGHGAMLGLPENSDLGKLLRWAYRRDLYTLAICHGPATLLAAADQRQEVM